MFSTQYLKYNQPFQNPVPTVGSHAATWTVIALNGPLFLQMTSIMTIMMAVAVVVEVAVV
jgi:hypothetical protein